MKIVCLIKFVPDVEEFKYDHQRHALIRENVNQILNPDDACAVAYALMIKRSHPDTVIEVVTMAPHTVRGQLEDLLRRNIDQATLISDKRFGGSDTFATTKTIGGYLRQSDYDVILTGTHSLDGDTSHVPSQMAEVCGLPQLSNIVTIDTESFLAGRPEVEVDHDSTLMRFAVELPAILSVHKDSGYKLAHVAFQDLDKDVASRVRVLSHRDLGLPAEELGLAGSKTQVNRSFAKARVSKRKVTVSNDPAGIETVYCFLKDHGFLA